MYYWSGDHWGQLGLSFIGQPLRNRIECHIVSSPKATRLGIYPLSPFPIGWRNINLTPLPGCALLGLSELSAWELCSCDIVQITAHRTAPMHSTALRKPITTQLEKLGGRKPKGSREDLQKPKVRPTSVHKHF